MRSLIEQWIEEQLDMDEFFRDFSKDYLNHRESKVEGATCDAVHPLVVKWLNEHGHLMIGWEKHVTPAERQAVMCFITEMMLFARELSLVEINEEEQIAVFYGHMITRVLSGMLVTAARVLPKVIEDFEKGSDDEQAIQKS